MKTPKNLLIPTLQNNTLRAQIEQAARHYSIIQVYYHEALPSELAHLLIVTDSKKDAEDLRRKRWVKEASIHFKTQLYVSYESRIERQLEIGNPFVQFYYQPSHLIAARVDFDSITFNLAPDRKSFKIKFNSFKESFYHDHDLLLSEAQRFHALHSPISTYFTYISIFQHDLNYLENLYTGEIDSSGNLHERIKNLIPHVPEIQKLFVKKNESRYYLIHQLEAAIGAAELGEENDINHELYQAIAEAESQLYRLVENRLEELKSAITFDTQQLPTHLKPFQKPAPDEKLDKAVSIIVKKIHPEEIYLFRQSEIPSKKSVNARITLYYLLIIGDGISNQLIRELQQSVLTQSGDRTKIIILGHRRIWVQENLFSVQKLMKEIMIPENKIYTSSEMHPQIHWEEPYTVCYGDLSLYHEAAKNHAAQYFLLRDRVEDQNHQELMQIYSTTVMRVMRVYLYVALDSYFPAYLSTFDIWKLCVFTNPSLEKLEFLFEKLDSDFYKTTDRFLHYSDRLYKLKPEKLEVMDEILYVLMARLNECVAKLI